MEFEKLSKDVIGLAIKVHRALGPGLLESAYEQCLAYELSRNGISFELQKSLPLKYEKVTLDCGYRIDLIIEEKLIIEIKSVEKLLPIHEAQLLTYMKLSGVKTGLLMNFNEVRLADVIKEWCFELRVLRAFVVYKQISIRRSK